MSESDGDAVNDFIAGSVAGGVSVIVGQPMDTVKIRLQLYGADIYKGPIDCAIKIAREEGYLTFFRGLLSPLLASSGINAILFATFSSSLRLITGSNDANAVDTAKYCDIWCAGMIAAVPQAMILGPTDLLKIRMQMDSTHYRHVGDCLTKCVKSGGISSLFQGTVCTILRDIPAIGSYFTSYTYCKRNFAKFSNIDEVSSSFLSGAVAGTISWIVTYPLDVAKTTIQTIDSSIPAHERNIGFVLKKLYKNNGLKNMYRGLGTSILRSLPVNAVVFPVYEICLQFLNR